MDALAILKAVSLREGVNGRIVEALERASELIGEETVQGFDTELLNALTTAPEGIIKPCYHMMEAGGKRIRPMVCLLAYRAAWGANELPLSLAVSCELLHNATLLHDDVIDEGQIRRGRPATRVVHGNAISVLGGDYLLVKTVDIVSKCGQRYLEIFLKTMKQIVDGELTQLLRRGSIETSREEYFRIIEGKTASLFRWSAQSGAMAAGARDEVSASLGQFGWHMGIAFQVVDDILDFTADASHLGKSLLADISEGKMTLPVILACQRSSDVRSLLQRLVEGGDPADYAPEVAKIVRSTGAVQEAKETAALHTQKAMNALEQTPELSGEVVSALKELCSALLERKS